VAVEHSVITWRTPRCNLDDLRKVFLRATKRKGTALGAVANRHVTEKITLPPGKKVCSILYFILMLLFSILTVFTLVSLLLVWRLCQVPIRGYVAMHLVWRGAVAGLSGEVLGVAFSSLLWKPSGGWLIGYIYWVVMSLTLGVIFALIIGGIQKVISIMNALARAAIGGVIGSVTALGWTSWVSATQIYSHRPLGEFGKSILIVIVITGIASGLLAGPLKETKRATQEL
jgi:hypothetical protein